MRIFEAEVGSPHFTRHRRGMQFRPPGEELRQDLAGPVPQVRQTLDDMRICAGEAGGHASLGLPHRQLHICGHLVDWLQRGEIEAVLLLYGLACDFRQRQSPRSLRAVVHLVREEIRDLVEKGSGWLSSSSDVFARAIARLARNAMGRSVTRPSSDTTPALQQVVQPSMIAPLRRPPRHGR
ncbi:MAG: LysR family transcriptional regulator [Bradyrhizobium sp.]|nr:LysR family transcriptional regulator [Bradyrhizobium sp.]